MATLRATTSSTWSRVDPDATDHIDAIVADYDFWGAHEELTIDLHENSDGDTVISIHGYAAFEASKPVPAEDGSVADREHGYTEEFLQRLAPHLEEQLVIETVGHEKCRFPLLAGQWSVWPDGTVQYESFDHGPERSAASEQDDAQYGVLNTERDVLLKLGQFGPTLTSNQDKAAKRAQGESHLELVRIETTPLAESEEAR
jgi:hypothetical protein